MRRTETGRCSSTPRCSCARKTSSCASCPAKPSRRPWSKPHWPHHNSSAQQADSCVQRLSQCYLMRFAEFCATLQRVSALASWLQNELVTSAVSTRSQDSLQDAKK